MCENCFYLHIVYFTVGNKQEMIEEENLHLETREENSVTNNKQEKDGKQQPKKNNKKDQQMRAKNQ